LDPSLSKRDKKKVKGERIRERGGTCKSNGDKERSARLREIRDRDYKRKL